MSENIESVLVKNDYEITIIYSSREDVFQEKRKKIENLFNEFEIKIVSEKDLGTKEFSYPIMKNTHGHYYVYMVNTHSSSIKKFVKEIGLIENIFRHLIIRLDKKALHYFEKVEKKEKDKKTV